MNRFLLFCFSLLIGIGLAIPSATFAQDQQGSENSLLPEIDPQDIEIRSKFKARFPGLRRQPILGFDPTPRVYQIDPNRTPFMETQEQVVASLPVSQLSRPDPPAYTPLHYASDINAFGRFGIGSYVSPEAKFWGISRLSDKSYFGGDLDFSSSDGHLDSQNTSFRFADVNGEFVTKLSEESRLGINGGFQSSFNNMIDLQPPAQTLNDARKEYDGFNLGIDFQRFENTITGWKARADIRYFNAGLKNAGNLSGESEERVYNGSIAKRWAGSNVNETFTVKAGIKGGNYSNNLFSDDWLTAQGGVVYERLFNYSTKVKVDASVYYGSDRIESKVYIGPSITVKHPLMEILTLTVKAAAEPYVKTLEQLHTTNRFLNVSNGIQHTYRLKGSAEASLEYANTGTFNVGVRYENYTDYPIFSRNTSAPGIVPPVNRFYSSNYVDAYKARAYASVTQEFIPDRLWGNAKVYLQSPQIKNGGQIPYEEKVGVNSGITVRPIDQLTFEAWADYVGSRETFRTRDDLGGFLLLGGQLDFQVTERFGMYAKVVNALDENYEIWQGYNERPFQAYGGVTVKL